MAKMIRSVLAILGGLIFAFVVVAAGEFGGMKLFPAAADVDLSTESAIKQALAQGLIPTGALASVVASWAIAALVCGWLAALIAARARETHAIVGGALFLVAVLANLASLPHPRWMWVLGIAEVLPAAYLGAWLARPRHAASGRHSEP
jgi:hypothetical protein